MSRPELHHKYQYEQLDRLTRAIHKMSLEGIPELSTPFQAVLKARSALRLDFGYRVPRNVLSLLKLFALSPGTIQLWLDTESGFFAEARTQPGAPPIYHHVSDEVAMKILKGELTHELEEELMKPDDYLGE